MPEQSGASPRASGEQALQPKRCTTALGCIMQRLIIAVHCVAAAHALSATAAPVASRAAFAEWLVPLCPGLDGSRATLDDFTVTAARAYNADQVIYSIGNDALLSPVAAYADKDVGPPLRDIAVQAGPGFGVVAVAGLLAAEKIRGFRSRRGQGDAAAAAGIVVPSRWGPYARLLWDEPVSVEADQQLVDQAVALLLPILETTARRAWTAPDPEEEKPAFLSEKWAWQAMYEDGGSRSWSRGELTDLVRGALGVAIASQRPPLAGDAWRITGQAVRSFNFRAEGSESAEPTALVPLVASDGDANAAFRAFTGRVPSGDVAPALVCVATRDISTGDAVVAPDPWS